MRHAGQFSLSVQDEKAQEHDLRILARPSALYEPAHVLGQPTYVAVPKAPQVMLLSLFILHTQGKLAGVAHSVGFQGAYKKDLWNWMKREEQGERLKWESNLMRVWRKVCHLFSLQLHQRGLRGTE